MDDRRASLAPAYDLVFTKAYVADEDLALNFRRSRRFADVSLESFRRLARKCQLDESRLADVAAELSARAREAWARLEADLPMPAEVKARLRRHLDSIRL